VFGAWGMEVVNFVNVLNSIKFTMCLQPKGI
jgi:hypothetical protein